MIPFTAEHLMEFKHREEVDMDDLINMAVRVEGKGPAYTGVHNGKIIGCGGIVPLWSGVADGWTVLAKDIPNYKFWFHQTVKRILRDTMEGLHLRRIQVSVRSYSMRNIKWAESLGFHNEGLMKQFGPDGADHFRFAMIRKK